MTAPGMACFADVETTGFSPAHGGEIVELGLALFTFDRASGRILSIADEYCALCQPAGAIPWYASRIHGITDRMVRGQRLDLRRIEAILAPAEFIVAHNASFDRSFMAPLFPLAAGKPWYCSMRGVDWRGKGFASKSLARLLADHGLGCEGLHRAGADVRASLALLDYRGRDGCAYLLEILKNGPLPGWLPCREAAAASEE